MTADSTEVHSQGSEISSKVVIEEDEKCVLDMSSYDENDLPNVGGDFTGISKHVIADDEQQNVNNVNGNSNTNGTGKDDPDGSYVFVSRCGSSSLNDDLVGKDDLNVGEEVHADKDVEEVQVGDSTSQNGKNVESGLEDHCFVVDSSDAAAEGLLIKPGGAAEVDFEAKVARSDAVEEHNETVLLDSKPQLVDAEVNVEDQIQDSEGNQESPVMLLAAAVDCEPRDLNVSNIVMSEELNNLNLTKELGDDSESPIVVPESRPSKDGMVNVEDKIRLQPIAQFGNSDESQDLILEAASCESSVVDNAKPGEQDILDSNEEQLNKSQECQIVVAEAAGSQLPEVEIGNEKFDEQPESRSDGEVEEGQESQITIAGFAESESYELDSGGEEKLEEENKTDFDMKKGNLRSENVVTDIVDSGSDQVEEPERVAKDTNTPLETEVGNDIVSDENKLPTSLVEDSILGNEIPTKSITDIPNTVTESAESESYEIDSGVEKIKTDFGIVKENLGSENVVAAAVDNDLIFDANKGNSPTFHVEDSITKNEVPNKSIDGGEAAESQSCELENVEVKLEEESKADLVMEKENVVTDIVDCDLDQEEEPAILASDTNRLLETENDIDSDENKVSLPTCHVEYSILQSEVPNKGMDVTQNTPHGNCYPENGKSSPSSACCRISEFEVGQSGEILPTDAIVDMEPKADVENSNIKSREGVVNYPVGDMNLENEVNNCPVGGDKMSCPVNDEGLETEIAPGSADPEEVPSFPCDDVKFEEDVSKEATECTNPIPAGSAHEVDSDAHACDTLENGRIPDVKLESDVGNSSATNSTDIADSDAAISRSEILDGSIASSESGLNCAPEVVDVAIVEDQSNGGEGDSSQETEVMGGIHRDGILISSPESSPACASDGQNAVDTGRRAFRFLIRMPRYDDSKLKDQIRCAQLQVDEKTKCRDSIRAELQRQRVYCQECHSKYEADKAEVKARKGSIRLKHQEIDSVQSVLNRVKNAFSVEDIDAKIHRMEHMIVHETLPLKEEKQFIREIKQLKHLREELFSTMGSQDEVKAAMDQKDQAEERRKILKKELDCLREEVAKAEATAATAGKKFKDENEKLKELQAQFKAADEIRQKEYAHLQSLRRQLFEKNKHFRMYKDDAMAANAYALCGDREGLHRICINQVDRMMELWNKDEDFRKEYIIWNTRSTLRRLRTLDGRSLGPDEEPPIPPSVAADERVHKSFSSNVTNDSAPLISTLETVKQCPPVEGEVDSKHIAVLAEQKNQTAAKTTEPVKPTTANGLATVSSSSRDVPEEEESKLTKEEKELARKAEKLRKEKAEAKLREQRRLEEKAKAKEALERKKLNAEKAQIRAELRAQKEAEQKEKEREKRARKKERKKAATVVEGNDEGESGITSETAVESVEEEPKIKERSPTMTVTKRAQKPSQFTKTKSSIPPPLRNRGSKRRMQQWMWIILGALLVLALFFLGNGSFFPTLGLGSFGF